MDTRDLFGGAISSKIDRKWLDASDLRQIPDNQEVLLSPSNNITLIVEVLEAVPKPDLEESIRFHFESLAHDNQASSFTVEQIFAVPGTTPSTNLPPDDNETPSPLLLVGEQRVKKFGKVEAKEDRVRVWLALWRISPKKNADLVLSINEPLDEDEIASAELSSNQNTQELFMNAASSLKINDWSLFAQ